MKMIKNKKIMILIFTFVLVLTLASFITASGCCFNPSNGKCSLGAEETSCTGGEFFPSSSCSTSKCDLACCILGSNTRYVTARECQILSSSAGFAYPGNWQGMEKAQCMALAKNQEKGACVSGDQYQKDCKYKPAADCSSGEFYPNVFCTAPQLNTTCKVTSKTMCYDDNLYGKDSCGNPDGLKRTCDYQEGFICNQKNNTEAYCKDLNCNSIGKKNGESWCVFGNSAEAGNQLSTQNLSSAEGEPLVTVGSRYFKQFCINGKVETEPCADFRLETCVSSEGGEAKCDLNPWQECLAANSDEADPETGSKVNEEACNPEYCKIWTSDNLGNCVETGGNFYCCSADESDCYKSDAEGSLKGESVTLRTIVESVNSNGGSHFTGGGDLFKDLHLEMCVPKVAGGLQFYSSESSSSSSSSSSTGSAAAATCAAANYEAEVKFKEIDGWCWEFKLDKSEADYYGNVGLLGMSKSFWEYDSGNSALRGLLKNSETEKGLNVYSTCIEQKNMRAYVDWAGMPACVGAASTAYFTGGGSLAVPGLAPMNGLCALYVKDHNNQIADLYDEVMGILNTIGFGNLEDLWSKVDSNNLGYVPDVNQGKTHNIPLNPQIPALLDARCAAIADCDGKGNWVGGSGTAVSNGIKNSNFGGETLPSIYCTKSGDEITCKLKYTCKPFRPSSEGDSCSKCGADDLPCSEYRCKSIWACNYYEPEGVDKGYCMPSNDKTAPVIQSVTLNPPSPLRPYTPVEITLTTDEASTCKFNLNKAGTKFDEMSYDFGEGYSTEHKVILTLPGQTSGFDENTSEYNLITKDGKYTLYVRCLDLAGNSQTKAAYPVNFEVMKYPDKDAPSLSEFKPISGSRIKFNTTEKIISFNLNEPSQCSWDLIETYDMAKMKNNFTCTESINANPLEKYKCTGKLTNITLALENETTFYIRCKDQPWIINGSILVDQVNYSRNEMQHAYVYKLKASERFYISEVSPNGLVEASLSNLNITLTVLTEGGAYYGKANCSWRQANTTVALLNSTFTKFKVTDSSTSTQVITSPSIGENNFEIKCEDESENEDRVNSSINLVIDDGSPFINRLYKLSSKLKIKTDEDSLCYYSFDRIFNCLFDITNASLMSGLYSSDHELEWKDDKTYYIKCKDIFGNYDAGCNKIMRTY